jgi:hypothetical protein
MLETGNKNFQFSMICTICAKKLWKIPFSTMISNRKNALPCPALPSPRTQLERSVQDESLL